jgi:hypothetical protein
MLLPPGIEVKSVKAHTLSPDRCFGHVRPYLDIEHGSIHAQIARRIFKADNAW